MRSMMPSPVARCGIDRGDLGIADRGARRAHTLQTTAHMFTPAQHRAGGPLNYLYFTFCTYGVITAL